MKSRGMRLSWRQSFSISGQYNENVIKEKIKLILYFSQRIPVYFVVDEFQFATS